MQDGQNLVKNSEKSKLFIVIAFLIAFTLVSLMFYSLTHFRLSLIIFELPYLIFTNLQEHIVEGCAVVFAEFAFFCVIFYKRKTIHPAAVSILITTGICFTFYGISKGLVDFDTNNISQSLPQLIDGIKTAFLVSVVAVFLGIVLKIVSVLSEIFGKNTNKLNDDFIYIDDENFILQKQIQNENKNLTTLLVAIEKELKQLNANLSKYASKE